MKKSLVLLSSALLALGLAGCSSLDKQETGTLAGAAVGGLVGSQFGSGSGSIVGAVGGAVAGGVVGHHLSKENDNE